MPSRGTLTDSDSVVEEAALFVPHAHNIGDLVDIEEVMRERRDQRCHLPVFVRRLVQLGVGLLNNADQNAQVRIALLRSLHLRDGLRKEFCVATNLPVDDLRLAQAG